MPSTAGVVLMEARVAMGLGRKAFAERLNEIIGPVEWPLTPLRWHHVHCWETTITPPDHIVDAALALSRVSGTSWAAGPVVDLDALGVAA